MKYLNKVITIVLALAMTVSMTACAGGNGGQLSSASSSSVEDKKAKANEVLMAELNTIIAGQEEALGDLLHYTDDDGKNKDFSKEAVEYFEKALQKDTDKAKELFDSIVDLEYYELDDKENLKSITLPYISMEISTNAGAASAKIPGFKEAVKLSKKNPVKVGPCLPVSYSIEVSSSEWKESVTKEVSLTLSNIAEKLDVEGEAAPEDSKTKTAEAAKAAAAITPHTGGHVVAIDAGHQRRGNSAQEPNGPGSSVMKAKVTGGTAGVVSGLAEYQLTLAVSMKLKAELVARGYQVVMIRESNNVDISNAERAQIANNSGAEIFLRIHANGGGAAANGTLTMCMTPNNPYNANLYNSSYSLSKNIVNQMCALTGLKNCGVSTVDNMTGINWCKTPVSIIEMGYMTNASDDAFMASDNGQTLIVKGIANGVDKYFGN